MTVATSRQKRSRISKTIIFRESFDPTLRERVEAFFQSGRPVASFTKAVLAVAALGGIVAVDVVAPGLARVLGVVDGRMRLNKAGFNRFRRSYYELRRQKLIGVEGEKMQLTERGVKELKRLLLRYEAAPRPRRWDRKWRLILFDIPDRMGRARDQFRGLIREKGCCMIQKSVWVYPFPCAESIYVVAKELGVEKYVDIYTVVDLDNAKALLHFRPLLEEYL